MKKLSFLIKIPKIHSLHKSLLLISNIVTDAGQFLTTENPSKIMKNIYYFIITNRLYY